MILAALGFALLGAGPTLRMRTFFVALACVAVIGCAAQVRTPQPAGAQAPPDFPAQFYREALSRGQPVYRVDPNASLMVVEVYRAGSLARLGHDHVVASHDVHGLVAPEAGRSDLYVALDRLVVDEPALRSEAKFDSQPSDDDIAGTRHNMLNALQAERYPFALISVTEANARSDPVSLKVGITLRGTTRQVEIPARIDRSPDSIVVTGALALDQTDFGIKPLSILGGAVQVRDRINLRFTICAARIGRAEDA